MLKYEVKMRRKQHRKAMLVHRFIHCFLILRQVLCQNWLCFILFLFAVRQDRENYIIINVTLWPPFLVEHILDMMYLCYSTISITCTAYFVVRIINHYIYIQFRLTRLSVLTWFEEKNALFLTLIVWNHCYDTSVLTTRLND